MLGESDVVGHGPGEFLELLRQPIDLECPVERRQPGIPGLGRIGVPMQDGFEERHALLAPAVADQGQAQRQGQGEILGMLPDQRLEQLDLRPGETRSMSSRDISRRSRTRSRGSGSSWCSRMPRRWASSPAPFLVQQVDQRQPASGTMGSRRRASFQDASVRSYRDFW